MAAQPHSAVASRGAVRHEQAEVTTASYLDRHTARELMNPGVVCVVEDASLGHAFRAMEAHHVHAVLVVGRTRGTPLGWVTGRGLLGRLEADPQLTLVRDAITEQPVSVPPGASAREVLGVLSQAGVTHVLVCPTGDLMPEGVVSDLDLARLAAR